MSKFIFYTEPLGLDVSVTINYDIQKLMNNVMIEHQALSWKIMGGETCGAIFAAFDENDKNKLTCIQSITSKDCGDNPLPVESYLWVIIDKIEAAYRARFLTFESVKSITRDDMVNTQSELTEKALHIAQTILDKTAKTNFIRGFVYGVFTASIAILLMVMLGVWLL